MTFKSLDLQMSIPRTPDVGSMQSQQMQRPVVEQQVLADQSAKKTEELRHKSSNIEETAQAHVQDRKGDQNGKQQQGKKAAKQLTDAKETASPHPYKGINLDISL